MWMSSVHYIPQCRCLKPGSIISLGLSLTLLPLSFTVYILGLLILLIKFCLPWFRTTYKTDKAPKKSYTAEALWTVKVLYMQSGSIKCRKYNIIPESTAVEKAEVGRAYVWVGFISLDITTVFFLEKEVPELTKGEKTNTLTTFQKYHYTIFLCTYI